MIKSISQGHVVIAPHAGPLGLMQNHEDIIMDYLPPSISPSPDDPDDGAEVHGLSNLHRSRRIADGVEKIGQKQWGSNASVQFVNNGEESNKEEEEEEEEENMEDEPISDFYNEDDDDELFSGPGQKGISLWDSLWEGFLREVFQLGMLFCILII
jgi:hypothetical protein